jgi:toxin-antitoxin system PIN domain toxin
MAFLRICTSPRIFAQPLSPQAAIVFVDQWLEQPVARLVVPGARHWAILRNLLIQTGLSGNLTTDAHIAALAIEQGYSAYSAGNDFRRFPRLKYINPLNPG